MIFLCIGVILYFVAVVLIQILFFLSFFFQAEDGIRDYKVTGVQTCALPILVTEGTILAGRYEILAPLGKGGMGMVYKARDRELDEIVALKVLRPEIARSGDMARRFRSEIKIARKIRHRNVCGIHEFGQDGHLQFIAMELIEGVDFKKVLQERGALPIAEAYDVSIQIAKGLQAIHDAGIVHRDLKTPN